MQLTTNTRPFIEAEQYSSFILKNLHDGLLPETFYRNVSDFSNGTTLHIKTVGAVTLQEAEENTPLVYNPIETGEITLTITEYPGDAWYVTDELREDGIDIDMLMADRATESTIALQEKFESDFLAAGAKVYAAQNDPFKVNGFAHKIVSSEPNNVFALKHLLAMKTAFDKANVPKVGRVFICDPLVEATLNSLVSIVSDISPFAQSIIENGIAKDMRFSINLYGFDIISSNRLYVGDADDGTTSITNGVYNLAMCIMNDQTKPIMGAWRKAPKTEGTRNVSLARDEFTVRARYGFGVQRMDTLGTIITSSTNY